MAAKKKTTKKKPASKRPSSASKGKKSSPAKRATRSPAPKRSGSSSAKRKSPRILRKNKRPALRPKGKAKSKKVFVKSAVPLNEEALKLARLVSHSALEKKALDVLILDVRRKGASVGYDYVVLATGESDRQLEALADAAREAAKTVNRSASGVEASPDWALVDFDDVVVHFFTPDKREAVDFEGLWSDAPRMGVEG